MSPDAVNGLFELGGAFVLLLNIRQLHIDRTVKGVDWRAVMFFTCWGFWNLYFYQAVGQPFSFCGACAIVLCNSAWLAMLAYYSRAASGDRMAENPCVLEATR